MGIKIKTQEQIELIKEGGAILGMVIDEVIRLVKPGVSTKTLDELAEKLILQAGGKPAFKGFAPSFNDEGFPCTLCTSVNEGLVHGPASQDRILREGDVVGLDIGLEYKGMYTDMARTVPVGKISEQARKLLLVTQECLDKAIKAIKVGESFYKIGEVVQGHAEASGFSVIRDLVGHGVGIEIHEEPLVPNFKSPEIKKLKFKPGMVLALEPMLAAGGYELELAEDGWTYQTVDKSLTAQFEHTVAINHDGSVEVLTPTKWRMK